MEEKTFIKHSDKPSDKVLVKELIMDLGLGYIENDLGNLACQISFRFLLGLFPFLLFLFVSLSTLNLDIAYFSQHAQALPDIAIQIIQLFVKDISTAPAPVGLMSTTFILAIYSSSKAFKTVIECINKIYYGEIRTPLLKRYLISILFVILFFVLIILPMIFYVFEGVIFAFLDLFFNITFAEMSKTSSTIIFVSIFTALTLIVMSMYSISLDKRISLKTTIFGAFFCVFVWWLSSYGFNYYVANFSNYSAVYGSIGTIILFFMWINIITLVLLLGALINKVLYGYRVDKRFLIRRKVKKIK